MSHQNKQIVQRWFDACWGHGGNEKVIEELGHEDIITSYPLQGVLKGKQEVTSCMAAIREAFPDMHFWMTQDLIAEGEYVVGRWDGGGTHSGIGLPFFPCGPLPANTGKKARFTGTSIFRIQDNKVIEEIGEEGALTVVQQLGLVSSNLS